MWPEEEGIKGSDQKEGSQSTCRALRVTMELPRGRVVYGER